MTPSHIDELYEQTLIGQYDDEKPWDAVNALRKLGTREVFDIAKTWCESADSTRRARGADVLAQISCTMETHVNAFPDESFEIVVQLLADETEMQPLRSAIFALGHIGNNLAISLISEFANYSDCEIRYAVACALGSFPNDPVSVSHLLALSRDSDPDVRDWATFGFGVQGDLDSPEIREALMERIEDPFEDARMEAMAALGKRQDIRIVPALLAVLETPSVATAYIEAAYLLLGMECEPKDWKCADYISAIRERFPDQANTRQN